MSLLPPPGEPNAGFPFHLYPGYPTYLPPAPPKPRSRAFKVTIITLIVLAVLAPLALIFGVAFGIPAYRTWYQNELIRRVHAQQPLFEDQLSYDDGKWPVEENNKYHENYFFAYDGYHLKGQDPNRLMFAYGSPYYGDVAVEVTAEQRGTAENDGVGILARVTESQDDRIAFVVMPSGDWWIARYHYTKDNAPEDWTNLDYGYSSAIHTGDGAQNQLLVILRGPAYYCFVNGRYLGSFRDYGPPLSAGHYGVYMNTSVVESIFTDFAVYPAPSTDVFA